MKTYPMPFSRPAIGNRMPSAVGTRKWIAAWPIANNAKIISKNGRIFAGIELRFPWADNA